MPGGGGRPMGGIGARYGGGSYAPRAYIPRVAPRPLPAVKSSYTRPVYGPAAVRARPIPRPPVWKTRPSALGRTLIRGPQKTVRLITNRQLPRQIAARGRQAGRAAVQKALPRIRAAIPTRILDRGRRLIPVARSGAARAQRVVSRLPALPRVRVPGRTPVTATTVRQAVRRAVPARSAPRPRPATQPATPIRAAQTVRRPLTLPRPPKPPVRKQPVLPPRQPYAKTAQRMIAEATKTERTVTPRLRGMASAAGGRLWEEGLKYKLKSVESLTRKLKGGEKEPADVLRYTVIFPHEQLAAGAQKMLRSLPRGYQVMRVRNGWTTLKEGTNEPEVGAYRGINTVIQTKKGRRFELQFHTPESLAVKEAGTHDLYETVRNRRLPLKMRDEAKLAAGLYSETLLLPPPGVNRIKSFSRLESDPGHHAQAPEE